MDERQLTSLADTQSTTAAAALHTLTDSMHPTRYAL